MDESDLAPPPKPDKPDTPKGKIANFWYHYKWVTIGIAVAAALVIFFCVDVLGKEKFDYHIFLISHNPFIDSETTLGELEELIKLHGEDVNSDGKISVVVEHIALDSTNPQMAMAYQQKFIATLAAQNDSFFIMDDASYRSIYDSTRPTLANGTVDMSLDGDLMFLPINLDNDNIDKTHNYWNWQSSYIQVDKRFEHMPENLYFGIRNYTKKGEITDGQRKNMVLLENIINNKTTEQPTDKTEKNK